MLLQSPSTDQRNSALNNLEIPSIFAAERTADVYELRARGRDDDLALALAQHREEGAGALTIELARDVVQQKERLHTTELGDYVDLRQFESQRHRSMLSLRAHVPEGPSIEL
jgi:hypothetical protein